MIKSVRFAAPLTLLVCAAGANADTLLASGDGFVASLPELASVAEVGRVQRVVREERAALAEASDGTLSFGEMLITVVAPGGLLYAAHKRARASEAAAELVVMEEDLALLEGEMRRLAARSALVAELR